MSQKSYEICSSFMTGKWVRILYTNQDPRYQCPFNLNTKKSCISPELLVYFSSYVTNHVIALTLWSISGNYIGTHGIHIMYQLYTWFIFAPLLYFSSAVFFSIYVIAHSYVNHCKSFLEQVKHTNRYTYILRPPSSNLTLPHLDVITSLQEDFHDHQHNYWEKWISGGYKYLRE